MQSFRFFTVDVFTTQRFSGNPLAVVLGADDLDTASMQAIAAEFNLSETTFVLSPNSSDHSARVRIFNRTAEMAFAGHPLIGTAFVLARTQNYIKQMQFDVPAGRVAVDIRRDSYGDPKGARLVVPQPLSTGNTIEPAVIAKVLRLDVADIVTDNHRPMQASHGNPYIIAELKPDALGRCSPDIDAFEVARAAHEDCKDRFSVHVYCRGEQGLRARMFAPLAGTWEDPATGSANAPLASLLLSLNPGQETLSVQVKQGVEMGRPSLLHLEAWRNPDGIFAALEGDCVPVMEGVLTV